MLHCTISGTKVIECIKAWKISLQINGLEISVIRCIMLNVITVCNTPAKKPNEINDLACVSALIHPGGYATGSLGRPGLLVRAMDTHPIFYFCTMFPYSSKPLDNTVTKSILLA